MNSLIPYEGDRPLSSLQIPPTPPLTPISFFPNLQNHPPVLLSPVVPPPLPSTPQWVELAWSVMGDRIPADHNYRLYSALVERIPSLKEMDWQLNTITGIPDHQGWIKLGRQSRLMVRCHLDHVTAFSTLDGYVLRVGQTLMQLGSMEGHSLVPHETLESRIVIIKLQYGTRVDPFKFAVSLGKQLERLGIDTMPEIGDRGCIRVNGNAVVGYGIRFNGLRPEESLKLQVNGLGGKRRMGCGVFVKI